MCDASNFGIGAALLQSHSGTNKMNLISANFRLFTQTELRLSFLMRECTAIKYTLTEYEFLIVECKYAVKTDIDQPQINNLHFPLYLDFQNNHYEVDLLGTSTFKPIPYSHWIKNNTQQKTNLTDKIHLSGPPIYDSKYTLNQVFDLHDPLDTILLSKLELVNIFLPFTEKITLQLLQKYQNFDRVIRQLKSRHTYKTKPTKADTTILGNKTLLRYFRKYNNTTIPVR